MPLTRPQENILFLLFTTMVVVFGIIVYLKVNPSYKILKIKINDKIVDAEMANNAAERTKGLMFRKVLEENQGMLFIFSNEARHTFWMANVNFPLDMLWIDKDLQITEIKDNVPQCTLKDTSTCKVYTPKKKAKYVLELNAGYCEKNKIKVGDKIETDFLGYYKEEVLHRLNSEHMIK